VPSIVKKSSILFLFPLCGVAAAGSDPALQGCWRSQQIQVTLSDGSRRDQNGDCVLEYDATHARSRCHSETGKTETLSSYELIGQGQLRVTPLDGATGKPKGPSSELRYRIEDDWLLIERQFAPASSTSNDSKQASSIKSVSIRVHAGNNLLCEPRGESGLRVGRTPKSSLAMSAPPGWEPLLIDPVSDKRLALAINTSFFVGAFVPREAKASASGPSQWVLVLDDVRYGPSPVRSTEFASVKKRFTSELGTAQLTCDQPDRVCASLRLPEGGLVYTELFHVSGRVVMVSGSMSRPQPDATNLLRKSVQVFVEQLRLNNAE